MKARQAFLFVLIFGLFAACEKKILVQKNNDYEIYQSYTTEYFEVGDDYSTIVKTTLKSKNINFYTNVWIHEYPLTLENLKRAMNEGVCGAVKIYEQKQKNTIEQDKIQKHLSEITIDE